MADWDDHHYCPKCRDLKGDDSCVTTSSADCSISSAFAEDQRKKIKNRNRYKSKKDQNSSEGSLKEVAIDDLLLDDDDSSVVSASPMPVPQKGRSLEEKLDRFFTELAHFSQRLKNLEDRDTEAVGSRHISDRDSVHVARQPLAKDKPQPAHTASTSGRLERRSATITREEAEQQSGLSHTSEDTGFSVGRKRSLSQSSEEPDPDLEQGEIRNKDEDAPVYADTLETIKNGWIYKFQRWIPWFLLLCFQVGTK